MEELLDSILEQCEEINANKEYLESMQKVKEEKHHDIKLLEDEKKFSFIKFGNEEVNEQIQEKLKELREEKKKIEKTCNKIENEIKENIKSKKQIIKEYINQELENYKSKIEIKEMNQEIDNKIAGLDASIKNEEQKIEEKEEEIKNYENQLKELQKEYQENIANIDISRTENFMVFNNITKGFSEKTKELLLKKADIEGTISVLKNLLKNHISENEIKKQELLEEKQDFLKYFIIEERKEDYDLLNNIVKSCDEINIENIEAFANGINQVKELNKNKEKEEFVEQEKIKEETKTAEVAPSVIHENKKEGNNTNNQGKIDENLVDEDEIDEDEIDEDEVDEDEVDEDEIEQYERVEVKLNGNLLVYSVIEDGVIKGSKSFDINQIGKTRWYKNELVINERVGSFFGFKAKDKKKVDPLLLKTLKRFSPHKLYADVALCVSRFSSLDEISDLFKYDMAGAEKLRMRERRKLKKLVKKVTNLGIEVENVDCLKVKLKNKAKTLMNRFTRLFVEEVEVDGDFKEIKANKNKKLIQKDNNNEGKNLEYNYSLLMQYYKIIKQEENDNNNDICKFVERWNTISNESGNNSITQENENAIFTYIMSGLKKQMVEQETIDVLPIVENSKKIRVTQDGKFEDEKIKKLLSSEEDVKFLVAYAKQDIPKEQLKYKSGAISLYQAEDEVKKDNSINQQTQNLNNEDKGIEL